MSLCSVMMVCDVMEQQEPKKKRKTRVVEKIEKYGGLVRFQMGGWSNFSPVSPVTIHFPIGVRFPNLAR